MAILPRYQRMRRRDWKDPFSWFNWAMGKRNEVPVLYKFQGGVDPRYGLSSFPAGTFTRGSSATYIDGNGIVQTVAANVPRYQHVDPSNPSLGSLLLLEGSRQNIVIQSEALATSWTTDCTMTNAYASYAGLSFTRASAMAGSSTYQALTFTGDGVKGISIHVRQDAAVSGTTNISVRDVTAAAWRLECQITISAGGAVTASCTTGTLIGVEAIASGVYRVKCATTSVTAGNVNRFYSINGGTVTSLLLTGAQAENAAFPSSYIPTTTTAVTRAADSLSFPFLPVPQAMTVYFRFVEGVQTVGRIFQLGTANAAPYIELQRANTSQYGLYFHNGTTQVGNLGVAGGGVVGALVELRAVLNADGSSFFGQSINGAAETLSALTAANALQATWGATPTLALNDTPGVSSAGFAAFTRAVIVSGVQTLDTMRGVAG